MTQPYEIGITHDWLVMPMRAQPWPKGAAHPWRPCPVCGDRWRPWAGSLLPCHAKCMWTPEGAMMLFRDRRTETRLETALGLTRSIIRAGRRVGENMAALTKNPDMFEHVDRSRRCDTLNCALIAGHEVDHSCRMRTSAVKRGELQWLWHEPGCTLGPDHEDHCTRNGYPTCGYGRVRAACRLHYGHEAPCSPLERPVEDEDNPGDIVGCHALCGPKGMRSNCTLHYDHDGECQP